MQQALALSLYYAKFDPETLQWQVIRKSDLSVRASFDIEQDARDYADLRDRYDFDRLAKRVPTIPPPSILSGR